MVGNKKKVLIDDFNPTKDRIPNKEFRALSPSSHKKWNKCRAAAHTIGATRMVSFLDDETEAAGFNPELYQQMKEYAHREIAKSHTKGADADSKGNVAEEEVARSKVEECWMAIWALGTPDRGLTP